MADACQGAADHLRDILKHYSEFYPGVRDELREIDALAFESAAFIFRTMAVDEVASRKFVAGLVKRWRA